MNAFAKAVDGVMPCGNFVLLRSGRTQVVLPQQEVADAIHFGGEADPRRGAGKVVALSEALHPLPEVPAGRYVLTGLAGSDVLFAWDSVRVLMAIQLQRQPVPPALRSPGSPIDGFIEIDAAPVFCSTAAALLAYAFSEGGVMCSS